MATRPRLRPFPLAILLALLGAAPAAAAPARVVVESAFHNENWFPLPVKSMRAAAVDTALAALSERGDLAFVEPGTRGAGRLRIDVSLIERAESVKLRIELSPANGASFVATASDSIRGEDYQGIHRKLEEVGRSAALRLLEQAGSALASRAPSPGPDRYARPDRDAGPDRYGNERVRSLYELGQQMKRQGLFREAEDTFKAVAESREPGAAQWAELAHEELDYGLPVFEADRTLSRLGEIAARREPVGPALDRARDLYRTALDRNRHSLERTLDLQRRLDAVASARSHLRAAMGANRMAQMAPLRMMIMEYSVVEGRLPDERQARELVSQASSSFEVRAYERRGERLRLRVGDASGLPDLWLEGDLSGRFTITSAE